MLKTEAIFMNTKTYKIRVYWMITVSLWLNSIEIYNLDKRSQMIPFLKMLLLQSQDILQLKLSTIRKNNLLFQS